MHNGHLSFHMRIYKKRERFNMSTVKSFTDQKQLKRHLHIHRGEKLLYFSKHLCLTEERMKLIQFRNNMRMSKG